MPELATHLAIALAYVLAAQLAFQLGAVRLIVASLWPPAGLGLAVLVLFGVRWWPGILAGALAANLLGGVPAAAAALFALGNTASGWWAPWRFAGSACIAVFTGCGTRSS